MSSTGIHSFAVGADVEGQSNGADAPEQSQTTVFIPPGTIEPEIVVPPKPEPALGTSDASSSLSLDDYSVKWEEGTMLDSIDVDLLYAADKGDAEAAFMALQKGANVDVQQKSGNSALIYASMKGNLDCLRVVIKYGANLELKDKFNKSAVNLAGMKDQPG